MDMEVEEGVWRRDNIERHAIICLRLNRQQEYDKTSSSIKKMEMEVDKKAKGRRKDSIRHHYIPTARQNAKSTTKLVGYEQGG